MDGCPGRAVRHRIGPGAVSRRTSGAMVLGEQGIENPYSLRAAGHRSDADRPLADLASDDFLDFRSIGLVRQRCPARRPACRETRLTIGNAIAFRLLGGRHRIVSAAPTRRARARAGNYGSNGSPDQRQAHSSYAKTHTESNYFFAIEVPCYAFVGTFWRLMSSTIAPFPMGHLRSFPGVDGPARFGARD